MSWPLVKLSKVADINPRLPKDTDETQQVTFLPMAAVSESGKLIHQEKRILKETRKGFTYFEKNDVIVAKITPCFENGKAALLSELDSQIGFGSTEFHVIRAIQGKLDSKYLFFLIWNKQFRQEGEKNMTGSAGQKRVPTDFLKNLVIPLPSIDEQKRIAVILDKADTIRRKRQQAIQLADDFLRSVFLDMFGDPFTNPKAWPECSFLDICDLNPKSNKYDDDLDVSFVPMASVSENNHVLDAKDIRQYSQVKKGFTSFMENDVLFAKITPCMENGKAAIASGLKNGIGFGSTEFHVFRPKNIGYAPFIYSLLHLPIFRKVAADNFTGAVGHKRVPKDYFSDFNLVLPPENLILKYKQIFEAVSNLNSKFVDNSSEEGNLFNSLSQKAFAVQL